jgi:hypothetical protein
MLFGDLVETSLSFPVLRKLADTPNTSAMRVSILTRGTMPFSSQFQTAVGVTPSNSANSGRLKPRARRALVIRVAIELWAIEQLSSVWKQYSIPS